jgi:hypothetical protein
MYSVMLGYDDDDNNDHYDHDHCGNDADDL